MNRLLTFFIFIFSIPVIAQGPSGIDRRATYPEMSAAFVAMPYLKECRTAATDEERYDCSLKELLKLLEQRFTCPWRDLEGESSKMVLRFIVNNEGGVERFLTLFSENSANRPSESINNALIKAVYTTNNQWVPVKEGGKTMPREFVLPVECSCNIPEKPAFNLLDTIPAYFADGHYQLESFIERHIVYPAGFLSKSGRQTAILMKAAISREGRLDSNSIRVLNLNQVDYRLSENSINIMLNLSRRSWKPAVAVASGDAIDYTLYFKVIYVDDKNPKRGSVPMEWDITVGNNHFFNDGAVELNAGNFLSAVELFRRAVFLDPDDREAWLMLGESYLGARNNAEARIALQRAIDLGSEEAEKWMVEAQKPSEAPPPKLPDKEVKKRPDRTEKVKPASIQSKP